LLLLRGSVVMRLRLWSLLSFRMRLLRMLRRFRTWLLLRLHILRVLLRDAGLWTDVVVSFHLVLRVILLLIVVSRLRRARSSGCMIIVRVGGD
jgi:hypothetical protein